MEGCEPYRSLAQRLADIKIGQDLERTKIRKKNILFKYLLIIYVSSVTAKN